MPDSAGNPRGHRDPSKTSGSPAAISEGSEASDNLSNLMKNSVVLFESTLQISVPLIIPRLAPPDPTDT
jgi:hypothetical protein